MSMEKELIDEHLEAATLRALELIRNFRSSKRKIESGEYDEKKTFNVMVLMVTYSIALEAYENFVKTVADGELREPTPFDALIKELEYLKASAGGRNARA